MHATWKDNLIIGQSAEIAIQISSHCDVVIAVVHLNHISGHPERPMEPSINDQDGSPIAAGLALLAGAWRPAGCASRQNVQN